MKKLGQLFKTVESPDLELPTERLLIRRFRETDWHDLYEFLSDAEVVKFEPYEPFTEEEAHAEAIRRSTDKDFFAVERKADGQVIGNLYFSARDFGAMELGYVFHRTAWHCGHATEAAHALMQFCFATSDCPRIIAECDPANPGSWKLLERLGMRRERHGIKDHFFSRDAQGAPRWADSYGYAILRDEFLLQERTNEL
ncbi:MAG: GNAT family N-acetyltransferase [Victivallaceae bacterium]|nr:GNAT family N-acetyltransferase [Victivallaceae bacterium]